MVDLVGEDDPQVLGRTIGGGCRLYTEPNAGSGGGGVGGRDSYGRFAVVYSSLSLSRGPSRGVSRWLRLIPLLEARRPKEKSRWGPPGVRVSGARASATRLSEIRLSGPRVSECTDRGEFA
jgi:hypothetical protein